MTRLLAIAAVPFLLACASEGSVEEEPAEASASDAVTSDAETDAAPASRIDIAMSAAPADIAEDATIMDFDENGELVELRAGTNGWLCLPDDNPGAPGDAPICVDGPWQEFLTAYMAQEEPDISAIGMSYMLEGGVAASNSDPFATAPAEGEDWIDDGPHLMVVAPDPAMFAGFPTEPDAGGPYVMWSGTPYAHLMIPIEDRD